MRTNILLTALLVFLGNQIMAQNTVFISSKEIGRGILRERDGEVFVITPKHVVEESISSIKIIGERNVISSATLVQTYSADLAIARIDGGGKQKYTDWNVGKDFESILNRNSSGFIEYREQDGSTKKTEVNITEVSNESITVTPKTTGYALAKGWSGSALFVNNGVDKIFLGLLTDIDGTKGDVIRADYMMNIMSGFFVKEEVVEPIDDPNKSVSGVLGELMTRQIKMKVIKFQQNNNKATFDFTLENANPSIQSIKYSTHINFHKLIDQNGIAYQASHIDYGNGGTDVELIYKVPVKCHVEFEVGANSITKASLLQLNAYNNYEFKFFNIALKQSNITGNNTLVKKTPSIQQNLSVSKQISQQVSLTLNRFEQNNNKVVVFYTLENKNPVKQIVHYSTHINFHKLIDQNGLSYAATDIEYGNGNAEVDLVYNVPVSCQVEFEVGANKITKAALLELNGYNNYLFKFVNVQLNNNHLGLDTKATQTAIDYTKSMGVMSVDGIKISVNSFEQLGSKMVFYYSLENINPQKQILNISTHQNFASLKADNYTFNCTALELGNSEMSTSLVYQYPVRCYAEFEVGAVKITKISSLKLALYNYDFEFYSKGVLGTPNSLKSSKAREETNKVIGSVIGTLLGKQD